jgi:hypothetical protein
MHQSPIEHYRNAAQVKGGLTIKGQSKYLVLQWWWFLASLAATGTALVMAKLTLLAAVVIGPWSLTAVPVLIVPAAIAGFFTLHRWALN